MHDRDSSEIHTTRLARASLGAAMRFNPSLAQHNLRSAFGGFFAGRVCLKLDDRERCPSIKATVGTSAFDLAGNYTDGDLHPLKPIPRIASAVKNAVVIKGSPQQPVSVSLVAAYSPPSLSCSRP